MTKSHLVLGIIIAAMSPLTFAVPPGAANGGGGGAHAAASTGGFHPGGPIQIHSAAGLQASSSAGPVAASGITMTRMTVGGVTARVVRFNCPSETRKHLPLLRREGYSEYVQNGGTYYCRPVANMRIAGAARDCLKPD